MVLHRTLLLAPVGPIPGRRFSFHTGLLNKFFAAAGLPHSRLSPASHLLLASRRGCGESPCLSLPGGNAQ